MNVENQINQDVYTHKFGESSCAGRIVYVRLLFFRRTVRFRVGF